MALLPWGKVDVGTNELPPKEATQLLHRKEFQCLAPSLVKNHSVISHLESQLRLALELAKLLTVGESRIQLNSGERDVEQMCVMPCKTVPGHQLFCSQSLASH